MINPSGSLRARTPAPVGAEVGLYVDTVQAVEVGHVIATETGRAYGVISVRRQERGKHVGRQHLRCIVLDGLGAVAPGTVVVTIRWYRRHARAG